jgi:hypothetical protein
MRAALLLLLLAAPAAAQCPEGYGSLPQPSSVSVVLVDGSINVYVGLPPSDFGSSWMFMLAFDLDGVPGLGSFWPTPTHCPVPQDWSPDSYFAFDEKSRNWQWVDVRALPMGKDSDRRASHVPSWDTSGLEADWWLGAQQAESWSETGYVLRPITISPGSRWVLVISSYSFDGALLPAWQYTGRL